MVMGRWKAISNTPYIGFVLVFLLSALIGSVSGYDFNLALNALLFLILAVGIYVCSSAIFAQSDRQTWILSAGLLSAGVLALYYITQSGRIAGGDKIPVISLLGNWLNRITPDLAIWQTQPNSIATYLEGLFFLAIAAAIATGAGKRRWLWWICTAVIGVAIIMSGSRGGWLAVGIAGLIWLGFRWRIARVLFLVGFTGLIGLVLLVVFSRSLDILNQIPGVGALLGPLFIRPDRLAVYQNSLALAIDSPFSGIGLGKQFGFTYGRYELFIPNQFLMYSHNLYLEAWLEQGLLGLSSFIGLTAAIIFWNFRGGARNFSLYQQATAVGLLAILIHGLSDARMYDDPWCWLPFFLLLGINASQLPDGGKSFNRASLWIPIGASFLALMVVIGVTWPLQAAIDANIGAIYQQRADLQPDLSPEQRKTLTNAAEIYFQRSIATNPRQRSAHTRLGMLYLNALEVSEAQQNFLFAYQAAPWHYASRKGLGLTSAMTQQTDQAVQLMQDIPGIADELITWGNYLAEKKEYPLSISVLRVALRLSPGSKAIEDRIVLLESLLP